MTGRCSQLRLVTRTITSAKEGFEKIMPLAGGVRSLDQIELAVLQSLWRADGRAGIEFIALSTRITNIAESAEEAKKSIKNGLVPRLQSLYRLGLIDIQKKEDERLAILTRKGRAVLFKEDENLRDSIQLLAGIRAYIKKMAISELEKQLLFATFADGTEESNACNAAYRLMISEAAEHKRQLFQANPVLSLGAWRDVEHLLLFPANEYVLVDSDYRPEVIRSIAEKLEGYAPGLVRVEEKGQDAIVAVRKIREEKRFHFIKKKAEEFAEEKAGSTFSALVMKKTSGILGQAKSDKTIWGKYFGMLAKGGLFLEADLSDQLNYKPEGMKKVAEGELDCCRALDGGGFEPYASVLFEKTI